VPPQSWSDGGFCQQRATVDDMVVIVNSSIAHVMFGTIVVAPYNFLSSSSMLPESQVSINYEYSETSHSTRLDGQLATSR
jgi:hypothetical protein